MLEAVKKEAPYLPVLIFSAYEGYLKDARVTLADGFVMKSSFFDKLKQEVSEVLGRKLIHAAEGRAEAGINPRVSIPEAKSKASHLIGEKTKHHMPGLTG